MSFLKPTLNLLADGNFHSDKEISEYLGISYKIVPKILKKILDPSINLDILHNKFFRISGGLELLNARYITDKLEETNHLLSRLKILLCVDSTNNYLLNKKNQHKGNYAVFAEQQTAARGQFQRPWYSAFGKSIALSLLWSFSNSLNKLEGLTLTVGIAVVKALEAYGLKKIQLKWPNDIIYQGKKLAGILTESRFIDNKLQKVVIGIGLNLYNPSTYSPIDEQVVTSIFSIDCLPPKRNLLAALILKNVLQILDNYEAKGLNYFMSDWQRLDSLMEKSLSIQNKNNIIEGIGKGINIQGQLCVQVKNTLQYFNSGEIKLINC